MVGGRVGIERRAARAPRQTSADCFPRLRAKMQRAVTRRKIAGKLGGFFPIFINSRAETRENR